MKRIKRNHSPNTILIATLALIVCVSTFCQRESNTNEDYRNDKLTITNAKNYYEANAKCLKFLSMNIAGTKNSDIDISLTDKMVLQWENALCKKVNNVSYVEVPIAITPELMGITYDGYGNIQLNRKQVKINTSLLIEKDLNTDSTYHSLVTSIGDYANGSNEEQYCFLANKDNFTGYIIFFQEDGDFLFSYFYNNGARRLANIKNRITTIDSTGRDLHYRGMQIFASNGVKTKGGGIDDTGEWDLNGIKCPKCPGTIISYMCDMCGFIIGTFGDDFVCILCGNHYTNCNCCDVCNWYPCLCERDSFTPCPICGVPNCNERCVNNSGGEDKKDEPDLPDDDKNRPPYNLNCDINISGAGTVSITYIRVGVYKVTATPNSGYVFVNWTNDNGDIISTSNPYTIVITNNIRIIANFKKI